MGGATSFRKPWLAAQAEGSALGLGPLAPCRPQVRHGQPVQVGGKRNDFGAGVKHHSAEPAFAQRMGHRLQAADVAAAQGGTGEVVRCPLTAVTLPQRQTLGIS